MIYLIKYAFHHIQFSCENTRGFFVLVNWLSIIYFHHFSIQKWFFLPWAIPLVEMLWYNNFLYESNTIYFVKIYNKPHGTKPSRMPYMYCDRWQLVKISRSWALLEKLEYKAFNKYINRAVNTKYYDVIILFKYVFSVFFAWRFSTTRKHFINVFYELVSW